MSLPLVIGLVMACAVLVLLESRGLPTTLALRFKGDIKRESRWLAQYGQFVCTAVAIVLMLQLDPAKTRQAIATVIAVAAASILSTVIKRLVSRVRPGRPEAGRFLGPSWKHANFRESFPSSHSAGAVALTVMLASWYPQAAVTFWVLALICALLRYLMDAHWPSDVLAGIALGYVVAHLTVHVMRRVS